MKTLLKVVVGLSLSAITFYLFLRNLDFEKVRAGLAAANLPLLAAAILIGYFGHLALRARRWATMLAPLKTGIGFYNLFSTTAIGYAVSWLTPGRLGEVVRPLLLGRRENIPGASAVATVGLERIIDAATVLALAALAALTAPLWSTGEADSTLAAARWLGLAGLVACVAGFLVLRRMVAEGSWALGYLDRKRRAARGLMAHLWSFLEQLAIGASFVRDPRRFARVATESLLIWVTVGASIWLGLLAAHVRIPFVGVFLLLALSVIGIAVPTPGGAGTVHYAFQQGLIKIFGIEPNLASVATVLYHPVMVYIPPVVFGLMFAWRDGLSLGGLKTLARQEPEPVLEQIPGPTGSAGDAASRNQRAADVSVGSLPGKVRP